MADLKMPVINSVVIAGNLTKDPVFRTTTNGTPVSNFTIACSRKFKDNKGNWREDVCYVGVVAWYSLAKSCDENLAKGSAVMVEGELQSKSWKLENGFYRSLVEIKAKRVQFLHKRVDASDEDDYSIEEHSDDYDTHYYDEQQPLAAKNDQEETGQSDDQKNIGSSFNDYDKINLK